MSVIDEGEYGFKRSFYDEALGTVLIKTARHKVVEHIAADSFKTGCVFPDNVVFVTKDSGDANPHGSSVKQNGTV